MKLALVRLKFAGVPEIHKEPFAIVVKSFDGRRVFGSLLQRKCTTHMQNTTATRHKLWIIMRQAIINFARNVFPSPYFTKKVILGYFLPRVNYCNFKDFSIPFSRNS